MPRRPTALVLSQHYQPEPNFITHQVAAVLAESFDVRVITSHPHYPAGRFYPGVRWWTISKEQEDGVTVYRVPMIPDHSTSVVRRLISYLSFVIIAGLAALIVGGRPQLAWIYHGPFVSGLAALPMRILFHTKLVLTCADLWPESFVAAGIGEESPITKAALRFRRWFNRRMDVIVCATRGTLSTFAAEGVSAERLRFIPVWVPLATAAASSSGTPADIVYAGNIGPAQSLETAVRGAAELGRRGNTTVMFAGSGTDLPRLTELASQLGAQNIRFPGRLSAEASFALCRGAKAQIISLADTPAFRHTLPSKLGFSLAVGRPILFSAPGETADELRRLPGTFEFKMGDSESFRVAAEAALSLSPAEREAVHRSLTDTYDMVYSESSGRAQYRRLFKELS